jgi:hypothetical protein
MVAIRHERTSAADQTAAQIDPLCAAMAAESSGSRTAQIGGDARFAESDADHTARVERETQLA